MSVSLKVVHFNNTEWKRHCHVLLAVIPLNPVGFITKDALSFYKCKLAPWTSYFLGWHIGHAYFLIYLFLLI